MTIKKALGSSAGYIITVFITVFGMQFLQSHLHDSKHNNPHSQIPYGIVSPDIPASMVFAGEKIDLTRSDLRERMDREILTFTYSHINTQLMIKRANRLFPVIEPILHEHGLPDDFKYLMIIESNGDIYARSTAGAAGLWQFMPATGKQYGLEINNSIDERYHIEKATRAACRYLKNSYATFGDWLTVAASYNAGEAHISKRLESQKEKKAINTCLVPETSRYLFRLLTAKLIFAEPVRYGFMLRNSDLYPTVCMKETIEVKNTIIDFVNIAQKQGLSYMQLRDANPWIRTTSMKNTTRKSYKLLIPKTESLNYNPAEVQPHNKAWTIK